MAHFSTKPSASVINGNELVWLYDDPTGTPADTKATVDAVVARTLSLTSFTPAVQDIVGALVEGAGGTYDDVGKTITLPLDSTLSALSTLTGAGVVIATATDAFAMRAIGAASATDILDRQSADARYASSTTQLIAQTTSVDTTLALGYDILEYSGAGAGTITIPPNSSVAFPVQTVLEIYMAATGTPTVVAGAGVTLQPGSAAPAAQYKSVFLRKRGTDLWVIQ